MENIEYIVGGIFVIGVLVFVYKAYKAHKNKGTGPNISPTRPGRTQPK